MIRTRFRAGAMGLMQLMPQTWAAFRAHLGLGNNPLDVHDKVVAGAAYMRDLLDRFGVPGFLAAYNAGPGRYADHLVTGRPLPVETRAYVAVVASDVGLHPDPRMTSVMRLAVFDWMQAPLFAGGQDQPAKDKAAVEAREANDRRTAAVWSPEPAPDPLFAVRASQGARP